MVFLGGDLYAHNERKGGESTWLGWIYHGTGGLFGFAPSRTEGFFALIRSLFFCFPREISEPFLCMYGNNENAGGPTRTAVILYQS
jgi:hypothetical protein